MTRIERYSEKGNSMITSQQFMNNVVVEYLEIIVLTIGLIVFTVSN
jgi:hypothetical protein